MIQGRCSIIALLQRVYCHSYLFIIVFNVVIVVYHSQVKITVQNYTVQF